MFTSGIWEIFINTFIYRTYVAASGKFLSATHGCYCYFYYQLYKIFILISLNEINTLKKQNLYFCLVTSLFSKYNKKYKLNKTLKK